MVVAVSLQEEPGGSEFEHADRRKAIKEDRVYFPELLVETNDYVW